MNKNPFSPSFGAVDGTFFGRTDVLEGMEDAVQNPASPYRLLFISGTRGSGKSSLLHELAKIAQANKWLVCETSGINAEEDIRAIVGTKKKAAGATIKPSVSVAGAAVSVGEAHLSKEEASSTNLASVVASRAKSLRAKNGIFIAVDEIQGVQASTIKQLCSVMQASRSQGLPIIVVLCGLPGSYEKICSWKDCSFVMRMRLEKIGVLDPESVSEFMHSMFARVPEIGLTEEQLPDLADYSQGQPFLMHLVGYHLYEVIAGLYAPSKGMVVQVQVDDMKDAKRRAFVDYRAQVLQNVLSHIRKNTRRYVELAAKKALQGESAAEQWIFEQMQLTGEDAKRVHNRALMSQVVDIDEDNTVFFTVPYFAELFNERVPEMRKRLPRTKQLLVL